MQVQLYTSTCEKHGRATAFLAPCWDLQHQSSSCGALSPVPDTGTAAAQDRPSVPPCPWHRNPALHPLCSLVLGLLHQRVPGVHQAQNLVGVGLQPGHDSRVLPQGVCPAHVQGCQLVQGGRLAVEEGCYSRHPPPAPAPLGMVRAQLCAGLWCENTRALAGSCLATAIHLHQNFCLHLFLG